MHNVMKKNGWEKARKRIYTSSPSFSHSFINPNNNKEKTSKLFF